MGCDFPKTEIAVHTVTLGKWSGFSSLALGFSLLQYLQFYLFIWPLRWNWLRGKIRCYQNYWIDLTLFAYDLRKFKSLGFSSCTIWILYGCNFKSNFKIRRNYVRDNPNTAERLRVGKWGSRRTESETCCTFFSVRGLPASNFSTHFFIKGALEHWIKSCKSYSTRNKCLTVMSKLLLNKIVSHSKSAEALWGDPLRLNYRKSS